MRRISSVSLSIFLSAGILLPAAAQDYPIPVHRGNGLANLFAKLNSGQQVTVAYFGGSITEGAGWRDYVHNWFNNAYPGKVVQRNAAWSGTGSLIAAMRLQRDVLVHQPDLIFVEYAVNDLPEDPVQFIERNYEGMVRQTWDSDATTELCFIETIAWYNEAPYLAGYLPNSVQAHYNVADRYGISSVNVGWALYEHVLAGTPWENLAPDRVHPNDAGSQIYANAVIDYLVSERNRSGASTPHAIPAAMTDYPVMSGELHTLADLTLPAGWTKVYNEFGAQSFIQSTTPGATVSLNFNGPAAALKIVQGPDGGTASISIDGSPFNQAGIIPIGFYWTWSLPIAKMLSFGAHSLTIRVDTGIVRFINVESALTGEIGPPPGDNIAPLATIVTADTEYSPAYAARFATDRSISTKWNSTSTTAAHWLMLQFQRDVAVTGAVVRHAGAGGEFAEFNTESFNVQSATDPAGPWTTRMVGSNPGQAPSTTLRLTEPAMMRYVRLYITDAGIDNYARIYEFELYGTLPPIPGDFDRDEDVDQADFGRFQRCYSGPGVTQADPDCEDARLDDDKDVDIDDFGLFQGCMSGPDIQADPNCAQ